MQGRENTLAGRARSLLAMSEILEEYLKY